MKNAKCKMAGGRGGRAPSRPSGMRAKVMLVLGVACAVGGILGVGVLYPRVASVWQNVYGIPFDLRYGWGPWFAEASYWGHWFNAAMVVGLVGFCLVALGLFLLRPRLAMVLGALCAVGGLLGLLATGPRMDEIYYMQGHTFVEDLDRATRNWIERWYGIFYALEAMFLFGVILTAMGLGIVVARRCHRCLRVNPLLKTNGL